MNKTKTVNSTVATAAYTASELNNPDKVSRPVSSVQCVLQAAGYAVRNAADLIEKLNDNNNGGDGEPIDNNLLRFLLITIQQNGDLVSHITLNYDDWQKPFVGIETRIKATSPVAGGELALVAC